VETAFLPLRLNADLESMFPSGNRGSHGLRQNTKTKIHLKTVLPSGSASWRSRRTKGESIPTTLRRINQID
jgi:hypothetical protein